MTSVFSSARLKRALAADGAAVLAVAVLHLLLGAPLARWLTMPLVLLLGTAAFLLPWGLLLLGLSRRARLAKGWVLLVLDVNLLWAAGALALLWTDLLATHVLGQAYLLLNAVLVLGFAALQWHGLRASQPVSALAAAV